MSKKNTSSKKALDFIKKSGLKPKPKWQFALKNGLFWGIFTLSILIGARSLAVVLYALSYFKPSLIGHIAPIPVLPVFALLPFFWIIFLLIMLILAMSGLHHTKKGYKIPIVKLIAINLGLSILLGLGAFALGDGPRFERQVQKSAPILQSTDKRFENFWNSPESGRLAGTILEINEGELIILEDSSGKTWTVEISEVKEPEFGPRKISLSLEQGEKITIKGEKTGESEFKALFIGPDHKPGERPFLKNDGRNHLHPAYKRVDGPHLKK